MAAGDGAANRALFLAAGGLHNLKTVRQVHSGRVVGVADAGCEADGLIADEAGVSVAVLTADCVPVLIADTRLRVVGAFHAGWRGTAAGIVSAGIGKMCGDFGCRPSDMVAAVGPAIGHCCYEVGDALRAEFAADLFTGRKLDLWEANRRQLAAAGVQEITVVGECTACTRQDGERKYFSYRAEDGTTGRMLSLVGVVEEQDDAA